MYGNDGIPQIANPDRVVDEALVRKTKSGIDPVYPLTEGLALGSLRRAIAQALQNSWPCRNGSAPT